MGAQPLIEYTEVSSKIHYDCVFPAKMIGFTKKAWSYSKHKIKGKLDQTDKG